jgi:hypothetical protein
MFKRKRNPDWHRDVETQLRNVAPLEHPAAEFAPQPADYSIDRVQTFLSNHIKELDETDNMLAGEAADAEHHLTEVKRRQAVTRIARDALAETLAKLKEKAAALDGPPRLVKPAPMAEAEEATAQQ